MPNVLRRDLFSQALSVEYVVLPNVVDKPLANGVGNLPWSGEHQSSDYCKVGA